MLAFLKRQNDSYEPKKSKVLSMNNILEFFNNASDEHYLSMKVIVIFALQGACRRAELCNIILDDITDSGSLLVVTLKYTKTKKKRIFTITDDLNGYQLYQKYIRLRPTHVNHNRLFIHYANGKCTIQSIGINTIAKIPAKIATFLNLPNASEYTGHCLRRTSATLLADSGADIMTLKRHGGWKSSNVAESYIEESIQNKCKISKQIFKEATTLNNKDNEKDI